MSSLAELASLKQLDKNKLAEIIRESLYQAISKKMVPENELEIVANFDTNRVLARFKRIVVERDMNLGEINLEEARYHKPDAELDDLIPVEMYISDFEPKVIRNARKAILERIKALEEDRIMFDYENQKDQIISGKVTKDDYNGYICLLYTSPSPRDRTRSRMPSSA